MRILLTAALSALSMGAAMAQAPDQPMQLTPPPVQDSGPMVDPPIQQRPSGIETQQLRQLDVWSVGALSRSQGALDATLWSGTDPVVLAALLDRLPVNFESPATQALARHVLLSGGDAPAGDAQAAARKRFEALGKIGAADELTVMASGSGAAATDPVIAQYAAQAELARGRRAEACARGRAAVSNPPAPFILRLRAYCAAASGDRAAADLALALIRGGGTDETWYRGAIAAASGAPGARPPAARFDNSLTAQLSIAGNLRAGANPLGTASNLALIALARGETAPQPTRAQAAALAYRRGILSTSEARTILRGTSAEVTTGLPPIALALRQVEASPGSLDAAAAISNVLRASNAPADFIAGARFFHADISQLNSAPDPAATIAFARAAVALQDAPLAQRLITSARQAGVEAALLAPLDAGLAAVLSANSSPDVGALKRRIDAAGASFARQAARDIATLSAIGFPLDGQMQAFLIANAPMGGRAADGAVLQALNDAAGRRAVGETALLAVQALGDGPARLNAPSLVSVLAALRAVGLDGDARRLAVEAIVTGAPPS